MVYNTRARIHLHMRTPPNVSPKPAHAQSSRPRKMLFSVPHMWSHPKILDQGQCGMPWFRSLRTVASSLDTRALSSSLAEMVCPQVLPIMAAFV